MLLIVDCVWSAWYTEKVNGEHFGENPYYRECQQLDCKNNGVVAEKAPGKRQRRILQEEGQGGKPCSPNEDGEEQRSLEDCQGDCPGK